MQNKPIVSIIIPTFNRAHLIEDTLKSIRNQTFENWECLVIDDGSTDNTEKVVARFIDLDIRIKYHKRPNNINKGGNACRNFGLELSKGIYINWFDDDDIMHVDKLKIQVEAMEANSHNFSVCQTAVFEENIDNIKGLRHNKIWSENTLLDFITLNIVFLTQAPFFRKSFLLDRSLKFDDELQAAQEWEFLGRVLYFSPNYHTYDKQPLVYIRRHNNSISLGMPYAKRKWHYFLARAKIYEFLKPKSEIPNKINIEEYLKNYLKDYFKILVFSKEYDKIFNIYHEVIKPLYKPYQRFKVYIFIYFVKFTGKGYSMVNNFIK